MLRVLQAGYYIGTDKIVQYLANRDSGLDVSLLQMGGCYSKAQQFSNNLKTPKSDTTTSSCPAINYQKTLAISKKKIAELNWTYKRDIGTGTIGLVTLVMDKDEHQYAIKTKYFRIDQLIISDLNAISRLNFKCFGFDTKTYLETFKKCLRQELNYREETRNHLLFFEYNHYFNEFNLYIPKIYQQFSDGTNIVSDYIEGVTLHDWIQTADHDEAQTVIISIVKALLYSWFSLRVIYCDPHYNNFLVDKEKKIWLIDFGLIYRLSEEDYQHARTLVESCVKKDVSSFDQIISEKNYSIRKDYYSLVQKVLDMRSEEDFEEMQLYLRSGNYQYSNQVELLSLMIIKLVIPLSSMLYNNGIQSGIRKFFLEILETSICENQ